MVKRFSVHKRFKPFPVSKFSNQKPFKRLERFLFFLRIRVKKIIIIRENWPKRKSLITNINLASSNPRKLMVTRKLVRLYHLHVPKCTIFFRVFKISVQKLQFIVFTVHLYASYILLLYNCDIVLFSLS